MAEMDLELAGAHKVAGNLSPKLPWDLANPKWAASINPVLANPIVDGNLLKNVKLKSGVNIINHGLGAVLQGYIIVMNSANVTFYDNQSTNSMPGLTLDLVSSGATTVSIYVF